MNSLSRYPLLFLLALLVLALPAAGLPVAARGGLPAEAAGMANIPCVNGLAGSYPCHNVDLLGWLPHSAMGAEGDTVKGNDHWGWTDPLTGRNYVIYGLINGTSFVDITDPANPIYLGKLPNHDTGVTSVWRDIKVYQDHAFIVGDIPTNDGLQVFDLTQLRSVPNPPVTFATTAHYDLFGPGHNIWINEATGFLYVFRSDTCNGGIHMVDVQTPAAPSFAGCFLENDVPLSDAECLIYNGPDVAYVGREICFVGSDDNVTIGDVTDKSNPVVLSSFVYGGIARAHQGALTPDHRYWLMSDTMDEMMNGHNTRTYVFDVADLDAPVTLGFYEHTTTARDHNVYIVDNIAYETNWRAGLRVLDITGMPSTDFVEVGYFDVVPDSDSIAASGSWSNFPWWPEGYVTVSTTDEGLFILQPQLEPTAVSLTGLDGRSPLTLWPFILLAALAAGWLLLRRRLLPAR